MDNSEFDNLALKFLEELGKSIEDADVKFQLNLDFVDGILNIELEDGRLYVINKHLPSKQIWLSSPLSGADYFSYEQKKWLNKNNLSIISVLANELKEICDIKLNV